MYFLLPGLQQIFDRESLENAQRTPFGPELVDRSCCREL
jgi:hypothetical protein